MEKKQLPPALTAPKRIVSWWIKQQDLNWPSPDNRDKIKYRAEAIAASGATTAMIFGTHFRWDFLPYFTLLHDYLATVAEELHARGVELYDHHSVNLVHRYSTPEEMRHVMLHSGPHLPLSPSREAAATWEYKGKRLNDWRMIDVKTRDVLYFPQYAAEGFCFCNPHFIEAYRDYLSRLIADTGIDGLSADDPVHFMHYNSCACPHCRAMLRERTGLDLPSADDRSFWGNWENPAWKAWIDLRYEGVRSFFKEISPVLPADFRLTTCGHNSAAPGSNGNAADARNFLAGGCNYTNLEMSGNTPPYYKDKLANNTSITHKIVNASHHQACAREQGGRCFSTGFGFTKETAGIVWAVNKMMGADCWFSCLKDRLGLPDHVLDSLPDEPEIISRAFNFEKERPALFSGKQIGQVGVYFSYETRRHTYFGNLEKGYYKDFSKTLQVLQENGISPHTVFDFPDSPAEYPLILLPSAAAMTESERAALERYLDAGGRVIATGPLDVADCHHGYKLPSSPALQAPTDFFSYIVGGVKHVSADWTRNDEITKSTDPDVWQMPRAGLEYHPHRISDGTVTDHILEACKQYGKAFPVSVTQCSGYLVSMFEAENAVTVHLIAKEFDTDIDHALDEIRFHRSRVNYINRAVATNVTDTLTVTSASAPTVYLPLTDGQATLSLTESGYRIHLPPSTAYIILHFSK